MSEEQFLDLIIKTADQQCPDWNVRCNLSWSVSRLKQYLCELYPDELKKNDQKLIYGGIVLTDETRLNTLFNANPSQNYSNVIHLVRKYYKLPSSAAPSADGKKVLNGSSSAYNTSSQQSHKAERTGGVSSSSSSSVTDPIDGLQPQLLFQLLSRPERTSIAARQQYVQALHQMHGAYFQYVQSYQNLYYNQNIIQPLTTASAAAAPFTPPFRNDERHNLHHLDQDQQQNGNEHRRHHHHYYHQQPQPQQQQQQQQQPQNFPRAFEIMNFLNIHSTITFIVQMALVVLLLFKYRTLWRLVVFAGCVFFALFLRYIRRPLHQLQPQQQHVAAAENGETNEPSLNHDNNETTENNEEVGPVNAHDAAGLVPPNDNRSFYSAVFKGIVIVTRIGGFGGIGSAPDHRRTLLIKKRP